MTVSKIYSRSENPDELEVVNLIKEIGKEYDIPAFTHEIVVEKGSIPHSHPVLTLNTRVKDKRLILKTLVHEQFHWYAQNLPKYSECIAYLKTKYNDDGEHNKSGIHPNSYWEHIIVCFNTNIYLKSLLHEEDFIWVYKQWQAYPSLEKLIMGQYEAVRIDLAKFDSILHKPIH